MKVETSDIIDLSYLEITFDGNKEVINKVLRIFMKNTSQLLTDLDHDLAIDNWDNVKMRAHTMKSSFNTVGAKKIGTMLGDIENGIDVENKVNIHLLINEVKNLSEQVFKEINIELNQ